jgi:hypothetical protein
LAANREAAAGQGPIQPGKYAGSAGLKKTGLYVSKRRRQLFAPPLVGGRKKQWKGLFAFTNTTMSCIIELMGSWN